MKNEKKDKGVVENIKDEIEVIRGNKTKDKVYSSRKEYPSEIIAQQEFQLGKERLFDVNRWSKIPGAGNAGFQLFDEHGQKISRNRTAINDFIEIDLPGPLPMFWVKVISLHEGDNEAEFIVQPCHAPTDNENPDRIDHFFIEEARSIFRLERKGNALEGYEIGINEGINNEGREAGNQGLINTVVSEGGWAGFQEYQWKNLTAYLVGELRIEET